MYIDASQDCSNTDMDKVLETATISCVKEMTHKGHSKVPEFLMRQGAKKRNEDTKTEGCAAPVLVWFSF